MNLRRPSGKQIKKQSSVIISRRSRDDRRRYREGSQGGDIEFLKTPLDDHRRDRRYYESCSSACRSSAVHRRVRFVCRRCVCVCVGRSACALSRAAERFNFSSNLRSPPPPTPRPHPIATRIDTQSAVSQLPSRVLQKNSDPPKKKTEGNVAEPSTHAKHLRRPRPITRTQRGTHRERPIDDTMAEANENATIRLTVKTPKDKQDIRVAEDATVKEVKPRPPLSFLNPSRVCRSPFVVPAWCGRCDRLNVSPVRLGGDRHAGWSSAAVADRTRILIRSIVF